MHLYCCHTLSQALTPAEAYSVLTNAILSMSRPGDSSRFELKAAVPNAIHLRDHGSLTLEFPRMPSL